MLKRLLCIACLALSSCQGNQASELILATGPAAIERAEIEIALNRPIELNGKSRAQVLGLRSFFVQRMAKLLRLPYSPSHAVFDAIKDGAPWYGEQGYFVYGAGPQCSRGRSVEGRSLLNPMLLVAPEFWGASIWYTENVKWDREKLTAQNLESDDFPYYCRPESLSWDAAQARASVSYDLTSYLRQLNKFVTTPLSAEQVYFGLTTYNARDFGLNFLYIDPAGLSKIRNPNERNFAIPNEAALEFSEHCSCTGGCNKSTAIVKPLNYFPIMSLPAAMQIKMWRENPKDVKSPADFTFEIKIR